VPTIEELKETGVRIGQPYDLPTDEILQHPPMGSLRGIQPFERIARAEGRTHTDACLSRSCRTERFTTHRDDDGRARRDQHGAARLDMVASALDDEFMVAEHDPGAVSQGERAFQATAVDPGAVARAGIMEHGTPASI
jgi:hypothetical protein